MSKREFTIIIKDEIECVKCNQLCSAPHSGQIFQKYVDNNGASGLIAMLDPIFGLPRPAQDIVLCQNQIAL